MFTCRSYLIGFNYTATDSEDAIIATDLQKSIGAADVNITSRITLFNDPQNSGQKVPEDIHPEHPQMVIAKLFCNFHP